MQPFTSACPVCHIHADCINFDGNRRGFTVEIFPGLAPASALISQAKPIEAVETHVEAVKEAEVIMSEVPIEVEAVEKTTASFFTLKQVIPICDLATLLGNTTSPPPSSKRDLPYESSPPASQPTV